MPASVLLMMFYPMMNMDEREYDCAPYAGILASELLGFTPEDYEATRQGDTVLTQAQYYEVVFLEDWLAKAAWKWMF